MAPSVGTIAGRVGDSPSSKGCSGVRTEKQERSRKRPRVAGYPKFATVRDHARLYLRAADCVPISRPKVSAAFQLNQSKEQSDKRGFGHKKSPARSGAGRQGE